ncbi:CotS family spore coat protein [Alteribacillus sp. HJP-4]|uniref:CotS family spore coat protein n=1 Tax=Alteribacillus sp. HJP-4 TaxID=2775394 RepID=UPI0035CD3544
MSEQLIQPWNHEENPNDFYVPDYIENMAFQVMEHYDLTPTDLTVMATKADLGGAIWRMETDKGTFSLKILHRRPTKSKFSLGAQEYLVMEKQMRVPAIIKTITGENYIEMGGKLWFVAEWVQSLYQVEQDIDGTRKLCTALGEFHKLSKGYVPPPEAEMSSRLHRWPRTYARMEKKFRWFHEVAEAYPEMPVSSTVLSVVDMFKEQVSEARKRLAHSSYDEIVARGISDTGLVHQDYGWSNAQMGENGMWIIDLDGVAFDITIRDLRKLINDRMHSLGVWDIQWIREMIEAYEQSNPISDEVYEILLIDLALPNLFYKNVKEILYSPTITMTEELDQELKSIIALEDSKWNVLEELAKDRKGGNQET